MKQLRLVILAIIAFAGTAGISSAAQPQPTQAALEKATFASGCFWGVESTFQEMKGVKSATSGYIDGKTANPTYPEVCTGTTGYAEAVEVSFDPKVVSYKQLLDAFWKLHNPTVAETTHGGQYRAAVYFHNPKQEQVAVEEKRSLEKQLGKTVVTQIVKAPKFYPAEDYHQDYYLKNNMGACHSFK